MTAPVMYAASSEATHRTTPATSSGVGHVGLDEAGRDDVGGDRAAAELASDRARHAHETCLARGVVDLAGRSEQADHGRDQDDPAAAQAQHALRRALDGAERPGQVRLDDRRPVVLAHPQEQRVAGNAGVRDQHFDGTLRSLDLSEGRLDRVGVGDVAFDGEEALRRLTGAVGDRNVVSGVGERLRDRAADAAVAPGHEHRSAHSLLTVAPASQLSCVARTW
jgi:hypothetical protein